MTLLLISNSTLYGSGYLDHCAAAIRTCAGRRTRVLFVPYAAFDHDAYAEKARARFASLGLTLASVHVAADPAAAVADAELVFVGGGNTFRLLDALWRRGLVSALRRRVVDGMPYIGSSAGSNVACPSIRTTNDMPIVEPPTLAALNLVPFQINPHYLDPQPGSTHMGETRAQRIAEFHEENVQPVLGLREGAWVQVDAGRAALGGSNGARLFQRGKPPVELVSGESLDFLMAGR